MSNWRKTLRPYWPDALGQALETVPQPVVAVARELRLRAGRRALICGETNWQFGMPVSEGEICEIAATMLGHALHARGHELREGYVTLPGGHRAGFCGRMAGGNVAQIASLCVRVAREIPGAAEPLRRWLLHEGKPRSLLIVSPPGFGKTTLLRDAARLLSREGIQVGIADERSELAACQAGVPCLDVGENTDVMDGCPKGAGMLCLLRAMSPQVLVTDELGGDEDARALCMMARSGVAVIASVHGASYAAAAERLPRDALKTFASIAILTGVGKLGAVYSGEGEKLA